MGGVIIYAIIETGGKQYKVAPGQEILVEKLDAAEGKAVELQNVLMINSDAKLTIGNPSITGAKVLATSKGMEKGEKLIVAKFKNKTRYFKKTGHRQPYTRLVINDIVV